MRRTTALFSAIFLLLPLAKAAEPIKQLSKRPAAFSNAPFKADIDKIPKEFVGSDPIALFQALLKSPEPTKREFETMDEFSDRHDKWIARNILGTLTPTSTIALVFWPAILSSDQASLEFDADNSEMTFDLKPGWCGGLGNLAILSRSKKAGSYIGQNAFGVKKVIRKSDVTRFCLEGAADTQVIFPVARDKAPLEKRLARFVLVGKLRSPYVEIAKDHSSPTIDNPYDIHWTNYVLKFDVKEVWVFSGLTGNIFYKPGKSSGLEKGDELAQGSDEVLDSSIRTHK